MSYNTVVSEPTLTNTAEALRAHGFDVILVKDRNEARDKVLAMIDPQESVMTMTSVTLEEAGITAAVNESGKFHSVRESLSKLDSKTQKTEMKQLANIPDIAIGSVHAVTEEGQILVASNTGSQLPAYTYGAEKVIWVVGGQKVVPDFTAAMNRLETYVLELESKRVQKAYGMERSHISKLVIFNAETVPHRITVVLVSEVLGY